MLDLLLHALPVQDGHDLACDSLVILSVDSQGLAALEDLSVEHRALDRLSDGLVLESLNLLLQLSVLLLNFVHERPIGLLTLGVRTLFEF